MIISNAVDFKFVYVATGDKVPKIQYNFKLVDVIPTMAGQILMYAPVK